MFACCDYRILKDIETYWAALIVVFFIELSISSAGLGDHLRQRVVNFKRLIVTPPVWLLFQLEKLPWLGTVSASFAQKLARRLFQLSEAQSSCRCPPLLLLGA